MIKKLTVSNYKSLKDLSISFQPLTVLAGPNASGKTNILDALSFVCDLVQGKDPLAFRGRDFRLLSWGGHSNKVSITIVGTLPAGEENEPSFEYGLEAASEGAGIAIEREYCTIGNDKNLLFHRTGSQSFEVFKNGEKVRTHGGVATRVSALPVIRGLHAELATVSAALSDCVFYDFIPQFMRLWQKVKRETRLTPAGENIAALLHSIQRDEIPLYTDILDRFKAAMPRVEAIETDLTEEDPPKTYVQVREKGIPQPIKSFSISEGTFRLLGILLALFAPNPARLVTIEGPETNVHPHLFANIADYLKTASKKRQVIVTTHSPHFIKHFQPDNLIIVEMQNGCTKCRPVAGKRGLREALKALDLGELYYSGELGGMP